MNVSKFTKIAWITLTLVYLVILAGSVVRMTGSGMGCPDWPKCFDCWIPPTSEDQLPADYREKFAERRIEKLEKFANLCDAIGWDETAKIMRTDESLRQKEEPFNATKTWIEYVNRLFGFLAGNLLLLQTALSFWLFWKKRRSIVWWSVGNLVLIGFQAWLGSIVVASHLMPGVISVHMLLALAVVAIQLLIIYEIEPKENNQIFLTRDKILALSAFFITIYQIYAGTQLRQEVDILLEEGVSRANLIDSFDWKFYLHRSFAWAVLAINLALIWFLRTNKSMQKLSTYLAIFLIAEIIVGVVLGNLNMPVLAQPFHLVLACLIFAVQFILILRLFNNNKSSASTI